MLFFHLFYLRLLRHPTSLTLGFIQILVVFFLFQLPSVAAAPSATCPSAPAAPAATCPSPSISAASAAPSLSSAAAPAATCPSVPAATCPSAPAVPAAPSPSPAAAPAATCPAPAAPAPWTECSWIFGMVWRAPCRAPPAEAEEGDQPQRSPWPELWPGSEHSTN